MPLQIVKLIDPINNTVITGGLVPKGPYNAATDYDVGDSVDYLGSSYVMYVDAPAGTLPQRKPDGRPGIASAYGRASLCDIPGA